MTAALDFTILGPALVAGLLVLTTHVPLGQRVLDRGIVFIDIAIAQFAALGVIAAHFLLWEAAWATQTTAFLMAIAGALVLNFTEKHWPEVQEAIIGSSFVLVACLGILLLANDPHGGEHLRDMLVGQILWTSWGDLIPLGVVSAFVLVAWFGFGLRKSRLGFYLLFALAVTASVQVVGVFLVFASLIMPALAVRVLRSGPALGIGYLVGVAGYLFGLMASALFDLPSGAVIVCAIAVVGASVAYATRWMGAARQIPRAEG